jgi:Ser/Thr protein kinase RdoA (MazF antagonist)
MAPLSPMDTASALDFLLPSTAIQALEPLGQGNINDTWRVVLMDGRRFVLQRLHPGIFADPGAVMANMRLVTSHLSRSVAPGISFFRLVANQHGQDHFFDPAGSCWRLLTHIDNTRTLDSLENPTQAEEIGCLLGRFHLLTAGIDPDALADPLPDFHITPRYLEHFDAVRNQARKNDAQETFCCNLIEELRPTAFILEQAGNNLSRRVIHGDPKAANFLFAVDADRAVSLIDFDTVKPGLLLHDIGDCLRSCCNPLGEGHGDPADTFFDPDLFAALMTGYLRQAGHLLTPADRELLPAAVSLLSFELGLRFFTDHLAGDRYFKVTRPGHNLHRALVQFHLHRSIAAQKSTLERLLVVLLSGK